jgi:hypothetical protein
MFNNICKNKIMKITNKILNYNKYCNKYYLYFLKVLNNVLIIKYSELFDNKK